MGSILVDALVFFGFIACVLFVGFFKSRKKAGAEEGAEDYFLAGRGLSWWLIGFSLIAANISAEQFVGMSGQGAGLAGISCASWEWIAAITLVVVAFCMLPYFLKTGITTMPEFLEMRYNHVARTLMTISMMGILVVASLIGVTYAGSLVMWQMFNSFGMEVGFSTCCIIMSAIAGAYVLFGGLKACAWADLVQGAALIVGGIIITWIAWRVLGSAEQATNIAGEVVKLEPSMGVAERLRTLNDAKLHMGPINTKGMIWTVLIMGIWIPNFYYWGLNQYITQRILGSGSLAEGQKGIVLAAALKLLIPFIIVIPGMIAFNLKSDEMAGLSARSIKDRITVTQHPDQTIRGASAIAENELVVFENDKISTGSWSEWKANEQGEKEKTSAKLSDDDLTYITAHNQPLLKKIATNKGIVETAITPDELQKMTKPGSDGKIIELKDKDGNVTDTITLSTNTYKFDGALGLLMETVKDKCPAGVLGFILAALLGAIVSSLAAVLNATSTLFTMDIYQRYIKPDASQKSLVFVGRVVTVVLVCVGFIVAAQLNSDSIFDYIQSVQCYVSPGVLAVFAFGMINRTAERWIGVLGLIIAPVLYYLLSTFGWNCYPAFVRAWVGAPETGAMGHYLIAASHTLVITLIIMTILGCIFRLPKGIVFEHKTSLDMTRSKSALIAGIVVCVLTIALYVFFW